MKTQHRAFTGALIALPLQFAATVLFALAFSFREWFWLQPAMLALLPLLVAATATFSALALRRIGRPLNWVFSAFLFPPLPALIYARACWRPAPAARREGAMGTLEAAR
jgi:predicted RND superfamily exporter protein